MMRPICEVRRLHNDPERIAAAIDREPEKLFGTPAGAPGRFHIELVVALGRGASVHQVVALELGPPERGRNGVDYPFCWQPVGRHRLLPQFAGRLAIIEEDGSAVLRIAGRYRTPLGPLGVVGDAVVGQRVAHRSVETLVDALARRMDGAVDDQIAHGWRPPPAMADLRPTATENWLG